MANTILNFHFDYWNTSLTLTLKGLDNAVLYQKWQLSGVARHVIDSSQKGEQKLTGTLALQKVHCAQETMYDLLFVCTGLSQFQC